MSVAATSTRICLRSWRRSRRSATFCSFLTRFQRWRPQYQRYQPPSTLTSARGHAGREVLAAGRGHEVRVLAGSPEAHAPCAVRCALRRGFPFLARFTFLDGLTLFARTAVRSLLSRLAAPSRFSPASALLRLAAICRRDDHADHGCGVHRAGDDVIVFASFALGGQFVGRRLSPRRAASLAEQAGMALTSCQRSRRVLQPGRSRNRLPGRRAQPAEAELGKPLQQRLFSLDT